MMGDETNHHPVQLLVNYWKIRPTQIGAKLDELLRQNITHIVSFVPWQGIEADVLHLLPRFLQAASERKLFVDLILTPEVGVQYPNSGLPRDLFSRSENFATDPRNSQFSVMLPPNAYALPSLLAPEVAKRYQNFLLRLDHFFHDLSRSQPRSLDRVTALLTGSFWKYYQSSSLASGDFSHGALLSFRQMQESHFSQREFAVGGPAAAARWKTRENEFSNRLLFNQQSESFFRGRSVQFLNRKSNVLKTRQIEMYTPEADRHQHYSSLLQLISGSKADFGRLSQVLDQAAVRLSRGHGQSCAPFVHWTALGGFRTLSDPEKQFLIIKSLLLMAGRGGGVIIDEAQWFSLSHAFRTRVEGVGRMIREDQFKYQAKVLYYAPYLWTQDHVFWEDLEKRMPGQSRLISNLDSVSDESDAKLLVIDPRVIVTHEAVERVCAWARGGGVVAFPRTRLYTEAARAELERQVTKNAIEIKQGAQMQVQAAGDGKIIVYDVPEAGWDLFLGSLLALSDVRSSCNVSDSRLQLVQLDRSHSGGSSGVFIMNQSSRNVAGDLIFEGEVSISDLTTTAPTHPANKEKSTAYSTRFALEVPPFGVLPVGVDGLNDAHERRIASASQGVLKAAAQEVTLNELPGFDGQKDFGASLWN